MKIKTMNQDQFQELLKVQQRQVEIKLFDYYLYTELLGQFLEYDPTSFFNQK